ncbi:unnamed protein product [Peronospora belbahrii]|uniref:ATP-dependent RNA helicase n=1 Tax=Peronospora belbahrii TaxID=622444 RepID=A0ABN8D057_9STRA|nr:unnamed protein product [Peronospora belbahrii]
MLSLGIYLHQVRAVSAIRSSFILSRQRHTSYAIPPILAGQDVVVAAETGGGKTLAFLLPVVEQLSRNLLPLSEMRLPIALVLTTSQELVRQLMTVLTQVEPELAQLAVILSSSRQSIGHSDKRACPLVFATPGALLRATKPKDFAFTQMVVVDEADMLLSGGFEKDTKQILATIRNQPLLKSELNRCGDTDAKPREFRGEDVATKHTQTIFSAISSSPCTMVNALCATTSTINFRRLYSPLLRAFTGRCQSDMGKLKKSGGEKTLVFTNSIASADALFDFLQNDKGMVNCALFHKEVGRAQRQLLLKRLDSEADADRDLVVVCTDIAARGLDTTKVGHVVQFEFAGDVVSYLHRIGRTGRAGTAGTVTSIESSENSLVLAKIREAGSSRLQNAFSRKRSLRKKFRKSLRLSNMAAGSP